MLTATSSLVLCPCSRQLNDDFSKMLLLPLVLVGFEGVFKAKDLFIHQGMDVVRFNRSVHGVHLCLGPDQNAANDAACPQRRQGARLVLGLGTAQEPNHGDDAFHLDCLEGLLHGAGPADLDDKVDARLPRRQSLGCLAPVRVFLVVEHDVGAELFEALGLFRGRRRRDDGRAGRFGELDGGERHAARPLCKHDLAGLQRLGLEAVQGVPGREGRTAQGPCLGGCQVRGRPNETRVGKDGVLSQRAVRASSESGGQHFRCDGSGLMCLREQRGYFFSLFELCDFGTDGEYAASAVRTCNQREIQWERVHALHNER